MLRLTETRGGTARSRSKRLYARFWAWLSPAWRIKTLYRRLTLLAGPGLFCVFGVLQTVVIGRYLTDLGWHWCPAWPLAAALGFTPLLGSIAAATVAYEVGWMSFGGATVFFLAPFWLFGLLTLPPIEFVAPLGRALRLLRASKPFRPASARGT